MCYFKGTEILIYDPITQLEIYRPVESVYKGDYVVTFPDHAPIRVDQKICGTSMFKDSSWIGRKFCLPMHKFPTLTKNLYVTGEHSILVPWSVFEMNARKGHPEFKFEMDDAQNQNIELYYLMAVQSRNFFCVSKTDFEGVDAVDFYHFILEGNVPYAVYINGGLLSETTTTDFVERFNAI